VYAGHIGIALFAKSAHERAGLFALVLAAQACDWVQLGLRVAGQSEWRAMIWSHSIPAVLILAALIAIPYWLRTWDGRGAAIMAAMVISHVAVDFVTGAKPTWPGGPLLWGVGLYDYPIIDFLFETPFVVVGWMLYRRSLPDGSSRARLTWVMLAALIASQAGADLYFAIRGARL
jgi:membrane-bound metal-dependent hydrolase YbcI (DUF457 family)